MMRQIFNTYFIQGILNADFDYFGGDQCLNYIPFCYHLCIVLGTIAFFGLCMVRYRKQAIEGIGSEMYIAPNVLQKLCVIVGGLCWIYTAQRKLIRHEGLFLTNPCHLSLLLFMVLCIGDNASKFMKWLHTAYSGALFGAFAAILIPHLEDLNYAQIVAFFGQHYLIWPLGPLILYRRYGFPMPTWYNHLTGYGFTQLYHQMILVPVGWLTKVSINFMLCPSPHEWFIAYGYHYFIIEIFNLWLIAYFVRLFTFAYCKMFFWIVSKIPGKIKQE